MSAVENIKQAAVLEAAQALWRSLAGNTEPWADVFRHRLQMACSGIIQRHRTTDERKVFDGARATAFERLQPFETEMGRWLP
jgi:hypothetical protein